MAGGYGAVPPGEAHPGRMAKGVRRVVQWRVVERAMPSFKFAVCREILKSPGDEQARFDEKADAFATVSNEEEEAWS